MTLSMFAHAVNNAKDLTVVDNSFCGCGYIRHWVEKMDRGRWNPMLTEMDFELKDVKTIEQLYEFVKGKSMKKEQKSKIEVNSIRSINNETQMEIIVSGLNSLRNSYIREIIETTFQIIERRDCKKCPIGNHNLLNCVCYFQEGDD